MSHLLFTVNLKYILKNDSKKKKIVRKNPIKYIIQTFFISQKEIRKRHLFIHCFLSWWNFININKYSKLKKKKREKGEKWKDQAESLFFLLFVTVQRKNGKVGSSEWPPTSWIGMGRFQLLLAKINFADATYNPIN